MVVQIVMFTIPYCECLSVLVSKCQYANIFASVIQSLMLMNPLLNWCDYRLGLVSGAVTTECWAEVLAFFIAFWLTVSIHYSIDSWLILSLASVGIALASAPTRYQHFHKPVQRSKKQNRCGCFQMLAANAVWWDHGFFLSRIIHHLLPYFGVKALFSDGLFRTSVNAI